MRTTVTIVVSSSPMRLERFPSDVLTNIFCCLEVQGVSVASASCGWFRHTVFDNNVFWYHYLKASYLLLRIGDGSVHKGPMTLDCFTYDDSISQADTSSNGICTSVRHLARFEAIVLQNMLHNLGPKEGSPLMPYPTKDVLCERSIDTEELSRHLRLVHLAFPYKRMPLSQDDMRYWTSKKLKCFHLSHYTNLERPVRLIDEPSNIHVRRLTSVEVYDPEIEYRTAVFHDLFAKLRTRSWNLYCQIQWTQTTQSFVEACVNVSQTGKWLLSAAKKRKDALARYRSLPGQPSVDEDPLLPNFDYYHGENYGRFIRWIAENAPFDPLTNTDDDDDM